MFLRNITIFVAKFHLKRYTYNIMKLLDFCRRPSVIALAFIIGHISMSAQTYRLEQVTSVKAGGLYVFEQQGHVMNNIITSGDLYTTSDYKMRGLTGDETYVWTLETVDDGKFKMKNTHFSENEYLHSSKTNSDLATSGTKDASTWEFISQDENTFIIRSTDAEKFLGYKWDTYQYRAYADSQLSRYDHSITVYELVEEGKDAVATPTFSPAGGEYATAQEVTISCATEEADIYYTIDGSEPSDNSWKYSEPITIRETTTLKAMAVKDGVMSAVVSAIFTIIPDETLQDAMLSFEKKVYYADKNSNSFESPKLLYAEGYDGVVMYRSSNESVATVDESTGLVAVKGVGTTTISASAEETNKFRACEASYTLNVYALEDGVFDFTIGYDYGSGMSKATETTNIDETKRTWTSGDISLTTSGRVLWYGGRMLDLYTKASGTEGSCEISVPDGTIKQIVFEIDGDGASRLVASVAKSDGSGTLTGNTWTGSAQKVTFKHSNAQGGITIKKITVTYLPAAVSVEIGPTGYLTYCSKYALDFPYVNAYVVSEVGVSTVKLTKITSAPANTPVILHDAPKTYTLKPLESADEIGVENYLKVSDGTIVGDNTSIYALAEKNGVVDFHVVAEGVVIPQGKCYLESNVHAASHLGFDFGVVDVIENTETDDAAPGVYYNLNGQRVVTLSNGIYILNNRKVLIK